MCFIFTKIKKKNQLKVVKLIVPAGNASITSPIGPLLGQVGLNALDFCNLFNERTWFIEQGLPLTIDLFFMQGKRDFVFDIKGPFTSAVLYDSLIDCKSKIHDNQNFNFKQQSIDLLNIYKIALLKRQRLFLSKTFFFNLFGTFRSYNLLKN